MIDLFHYTKTEQEKLLKTMTILIDTREHEGKNDHIIKYFDNQKIPWKKTTLVHGDYSCMIPKNDDYDIPRDLYFTDSICIERKANLSEWAKNVTEDRSGVKKKFALAPKNKVLLIENGNYADMINGKYYGNYSPKSYWATFHSIWNEFDIPIIFMPDPNYSPIFIYGYFYYYVRNIIK